MKKNKPKSLKEAKKKYEKFLMEETPGYLVEIAEILYQNSLNYHEKFGVYPEDLIISSDSKPDQLARILHKYASSGSSARISANLLAEFASILLDEEVSIDTCKSSSPTKSYMPTTGGIWVVTVPIKRQTTSFPLESPVLYKSKGNRGASNSSFVNFTHLGKVSSSHFGNYQTEVRVPSFIEVLEFLNNFALNCPEVLAEMQEEMGLVKEDTSKK